MKLACEVADGDLVGEGEAIRLLGLEERPNPPAAIAWLVRKHGLAVYRVFRGVRRYRRTELLRWLEERRSST